jgi:hypothetical protein
MTVVAASTLAMTCALPAKCVIRFPVIAVFAATRIKTPAVWAVRMAALSHAVRRRMVAAVLSLAPTAVMSTKSVRQTINVCGRTTGDEAVKRGLAGWRPLFTLSSGLEPVVNLLIVAALCVASLVFGLAVSDKLEPPSPRVVLTAPKKAAPPSPSFTIPEVNVDDLPKVPAVSHYRPHASCPLPRAPVEKCPF